MKIRPLHDRVIVKRMEEERTTPGGIVIPDAATEKPIKGEVIAAGNGKILENGDIRALDVKVGDKVLFGKYAGTEVKVEGEELLVRDEGRRHHGGDRGLRTRYPIKLFNQAAGAAVDIRGNTHGC
jgi:chaperonin GroES